MGYFSDFDLREKEDRTYYGFEEQLLARHADLEARYDELLRADAPIYDGEYLSGDDFRYAPVGYFTCLSAVRRAKDVAREELATRCGIILEGDTSATKKEEVDPNQLSIFEVIVFPRPLARPVAA